MNDLRHDSSASSSALLARNTDWAVESKKSCALSVDDQKPEQVEVARRGSGDGRVDGQVGPSKDIVGEFDDVRRTEDKGNDARSCRSCRRQEVKPHWFYGASVADASTCNRTLFSIGHPHEMALESLRLIPYFLTVSVPAVMKSIALP